MTDRLPTLAGTRIPYHPIVQERYGVAAEQWRALVESVFPSAKTLEGVILALSYCKARNLDVFKRPVHIVPIWNSALNREVETCWPGIGELRTTAFRTGQYAGADPIVFGPDVTRTFRGQVGRGERQRNAEETVTFPEWAQFTVYRLDRHGAVHKWPGPRVYWLETYQKQGRSEVPNEMWTRRARGQLEKCAEAAALRRAFPEEIGEEYIGDEAPTMRDITPAQPEATRPAPEDPMDRVVAEARTNGAGDNAEPRQAPQAATTPPIATKPPSPLDEAPAPAEAPRKRAGRPTNAERNERLAQQIHHDIEQCGDEFELHETQRRHQSTIDGLPEDMRTEIAAAMSDKARSFPEPDDDGDMSREPSPGPDDDQPEVSEVDAWMTATRATIAGLPAIGHVTAYRPRYLREAAEFGPAIVAEVERLLDERAAALPKPPGKG